MLSDSCELGEEVQRRIGLAAASFGKLSNRVFHNRSLSLCTKVKVYRAICISIPLYGCEAWVPYRRHIRALESFHIRCLQRMMGIKWWHRVPHLEIRHRASIDTLECILAQRQLRWAGHVRRMPESRLPRQVMYGEMAEGARLQGGQRKRFKDNLKAILKKCDISHSDWEAVPGDRDLWRQTCCEGLERYADKCDAAAEERRTRRRRSFRPQAQYPCDMCGRVCGSGSGSTATKELINGLGIDFAERVVIVASDG